jgi:hypothetical protein
LKMTMIVSIADSKQSSIVRCLQAGMPVVVDKLGEVTVAGLKRRRTRDHCPRQACRHPIIGDLKSSGFAVVESIM